MLPASLSRHKRRAEKRDACDGRVSVLSGVSLVLVIIIVITISIIIISIIILVTRREKRAPHRP